LDGTIIHYAYLERKSTQRNYINPNSKGKTN
jgi:hypothetical protein